MKFDPDIKYNQLSQFYREDLSFLDVENIRINIWILILACYDLPLIMGLFATAKVEFLWINLPIIIVIHVWGIRHSFKNVYSTQVESILFTAVFSSLAALSLLIMTTGMLIYALLITNIYYYIIFALIIIISSYPIIKFQMDKRLRDPFEEGSRTLNTKYGGLAYSAGGIGLIITAIVGDNLTLENIVMTVVLYSFYLFNLYFAAKFTYKYLLIKANIHLVKFRKPSKKEQYKLQEKGVEIK